MSRADCTVRALAALLDLSYEDAERIAAEAGRRKGRTFHAHRLARYLQGTNWPLRKLHMKRRTLDRFLREHPAGRFLCRKRGHAFAVIDGQVSDGTARGSLVTDAWELRPADLDRAIEAMAQAIVDYQLGYKLPRSS